MRLLVITPWFPTIAAPVAGVFVQRDADLLSSAHDVTLAHLVDPALLSESDLSADSASPYPIHRIPMSRARPGALLSAWRQLRPLIADADVVHTQAFQSLLPLWGHRIDAPWVHSEHWSGIGDPASLTPRGRLVLKATGRMLDRPDVVTAVSTHLLDQVRRFRSRQTMVVPSVVQDSAADRPPRDPSRLRLVSVGNLVHGKDPQLAVATVRELHRRGVAASLDWVGDGPLRSELEALVTPEDQVTWQGATDAAGVASALSGADIFLLPTRGETLCLSAIEAISHGLPVVMGAFGGQRDYITPDNGRLVEPRTADAYADAVREVERELDRLAPSNVAETIRGRFSPASVARGYEEAFVQAIAEHRRRTT